MKLDFKWILLGVVTGIMVGIVSTIALTSSLACEEQVVYSDKVLTDEQVYKFSCKSIMNSDIMEAKNPDEFSDELISFVARVGSVIELDGEYIYYVNDIGLSDGGGIWKTTFPDRFEVGDMIIIYGSNAIRAEDKVSIDAKYMEIYRQ